MRQPPGRRRAHRKAHLRRASLHSHERRLAKQGYTLIAGVDEAGRGPLAGPVVASAVILKGLGFSERIDDSKRLSASQREKAYREIIEKAVVGIGIVDEKTIDNINIYQATKRAMELALADLAVEPEYVLVDGTMRPQTRCACLPIIRGDSLSISIAAASIVAKVTRDAIMRRLDRLYPQYGFTRHKGYPTRSHKAALAAFGPSPIHRFSFQPVACAKRPACETTLRVSAT